MRQIKQDTQIILTELLDVVKRAEKEVVVPQRRLGAHEIKWQWEQP